MAAAATTAAEMKKGKEEEADKGEEEEEEERRGATLHTRVHPPPSRPRLSAVVTRRETPGLALARRPRIRFTSITNGLYRVLPGMKNNVGSGDTPGSRGGEWERG